MKDLVFIDHQTFLTFFEPEDNRVQQKIADFFNQIINGKQKAYTTTHVLIKVAEKLEESGRWKKEEIANNLKLVLLTPNLKVSYKDVFEEAIKTYLESDLNLFDSYHVVIMKRMGSKKYFSINKKFQGFENLYE
ncbi:MAG: PIN domain-containing protein [Actinobacteria bacterium]|nr:PIN domain-containing protein [Actinomycetota bacterium]